LLVAQVAGEDSVYEIDAIVPVGPHGRGLKRKPAVQDIPELKFGVAPLGRDVGNLLNHAESISALNISSRQPRIQLPAKVDAGPILSLICPDGCVAQRGV